MTIKGSKFQSVALPNGIIGNMYGPVGKRNRILNDLSVDLKDPKIFNLNVFNFFAFFIEDRRHDAAMLADSKPLQYMQRYTF